MRHARVPLSAAFALALITACGACGHTPPRPPVTKGPTIVTAPPAPPAAEPKSDPFADDAAIARAGQEYLDLYAELHPEEATTLGLHARDAELDDRTIAGHDKATLREEAMLTSLESRFEVPKASAPARTDLALLTGALRCRIRTNRLQRPLQRQPDVYLAPLDAIFQMTARPYAPLAERAKNAVERLEKIPKTVELAKQNLLNPPKVWTEIAIESAGQAKTFLDQQRAALVEGLPAETARVDAALKAATLAYEDYRRFLQRQILPRSNGRFAAGRELFELLLAQDAFLEGGADELLALGKKAYAETSARMTEVARRMDPNAKGWPEVLAKVKERHPAAEELLEAYRREVSRARAFLVAKDVVPFPASEELAVVDTPAFMRSTVTAAYDQPPPFDVAVNKGFFFVTPVDKNLSKREQEQMLRENDWAGLVNTAVHEAYPGHHLQLAFARRSPSLVRRAEGRAIFAEGWALYAEELMAELGYYDDAQRLVQLQWVLVRAARVILDVGLHVGDMTFEAAVKMLTDEVHLEKPLALSEVKRYTESPTQPSAYLAGRESILRLRERAKEKAGKDFSLKAFHADVLQRGSVPPGLLAKEMFE